MIEPPPIFFMPGTTAWIAKNAGPLVHGDARVVVLGRHIHE